MTAALATTELTAAEARQLEHAFLSGLNEAQDAFERIVACQAWRQLGHDSLASWWDGNVQPVMRALSMRPTPALAAAVVDQVRAEEAALPSTQRRTQKELAEMVGVDRSALANRDGSRSSRREESRGSDLEGTTKTPEPVAATSTAPAGSGSTSAPDAPPSAPGADPAPVAGPAAEQAAPRQEPDGGAAFADLDRQLDAEMEGTDQRFRRNFSAALAKADDIWQFDVDRIAEAYAADYEQAIRPFLEEMGRWCDRVRAARRKASGLRVVGGAR